MNQGKIIRVGTVSTVHFTGAIAQNAIANETITPVGPAYYVPAAISAGGNNRARLKAIRITSVENLAWEIWLWNNNLFNTGTIDTGKLAGFWSFDGSMSVRVAGTGLYYNYIDGLDVAIEDLNAMGQIYLSLINRSAAAKTAGANGAIKIELEFEATS